MKGNLIFCKNRLNEKLSLVAFDSDFFSVVSGLEKHNVFIQENGDLQEASGNVIGDIKDDTLLFERKSYYILNRYDDLNMDELHAVVDTHKEVLIRRVLNDNGFSVAEIDKAFDNEDVYALLMQ